MPPSSSRRPALHLAANLRPPGGRATARALRVSGLCGGGQPELVHGPGPHFDLADLAGDGHGELLDDLDVAGDFVAGEFAVGELADGVGGEWFGAGAHPDPGAQLFAVLGVRDADDLGVEHVGVGVEDLLDLAGVEVLPTADDHVLDPAGDAQVTLGVHDRQVAG